MTESNATMGSTGLAATNNNPHVCKLFTPNALPTSASLVAQKIMKIPAAEQKQQVTNLLEFIKQEDSILLQLNGNNMPYTVLVHIPGTGSVKVCCGLGVGAGGIGKAPPLDRKFLTLTGDGGKESGILTTFQLPTDCCKLMKIGRMTNKQFFNQIALVHDLDFYPLVASRNVTNTAEVMLMAPVPPYLVYDSFDGLLDAGNIYKRTLIQSTNGPPELYNYLQDFLLACLQSHTKTKPSPSLSVTGISKIPSTEAKTWEEQKFIDLFPTLKPPS